MDTVQSASVHLRERGISVLDEGEGKPIVLLHGFAANAEMDWRQTNWIAGLKSSNQRVVCPDALGHGNSSKPHDWWLYSFDRLVEDARQVVKACTTDGGKVDLLGYSMGAHIALGVALNEPDAVDRLILGGMGHNIIGTVGLGDAFVSALESEENATSKSLAKFRASALAVAGNDPLALAASLKGQRGEFPVDRLGQIKVPTLLFKGREDHFTGDLSPVAEALGGPVCIQLSKGNHATALQDPEAIENAVAFLKKATAQYI